MDKKIVALVALIALILPTVVATTYTLNDTCILDITITTPQDGGIYPILSSATPKIFNAYIVVKPIRASACNDLVVGVWRRQGITNLFELVTYDTLVIDYGETNTLFWIVPIDADITPDTIKDYVLKLGVATQHNAPNPPLIQEWLETRNFQIQIVDNLPPLTCSSIEWSTPLDGETVEWGSDWVVMHIPAHNTSDSVIVEIKRGATVITSVDPRSGTSDQLATFKISDYVTEPNDYYTLTLKVNGSSCESRTVYLKLDLQYSYAWYDPKSGETYNSSVPYDITVSYSKGAGKICLKKCYGTTCDLLASWAAGTSSSFVLNVNHTDPGTYTARLYIDLTGTCQGEWQVIETRTYTVDTNYSTTLDCNLATVTWISPNDGDVYEIPEGSTSYQVRVHASITELNYPYAIKFRLIDQAGFEEWNKVIYGPADILTDIPLVEGTYTIYYYIFDRLNPNTRSQACDTRTFEVKAPPQPPPPAPSCATANYSIISPVEGGTYKVGDLKLIIDVLSGDLTYNGEVVYRYKVDLYKFVGVWSKRETIYIYDEGRTEHPFFNDNEEGHYKISISKEKIDGTDNTGVCSEVEFDLAYTYDLNYFWLHPGNNARYTYREGETPQVPFVAWLEYNIQNPNGHICFQLGSFQNGWVWNVLKDFTGAGTVDINEILPITTAGYYRMQLYFSTQNCLTVDELIEERTFTVAEERNVTTTPEINGWIEEEAWPTEEVISLPPSQREYSSVTINLYDFLPDFLYYALGVVLVLPIHAHPLAALSAFAVWLTIGIWAGLFHYPTLAVLFVIVTVAFIVARLMGVIA